MGKYLHPLASAENMKWATRIYLKLMRLAPDLLTCNQCIKFEAEGYFSPICLELMKSSQGCHQVQLQHSWSEANGELICDPRFTILLYPDWEMAEAVAHSDMFGLSDAYPIKGGPVDIKVYLSINMALESWLDNLLSNDHLQRGAA